MPTTKVREYYATQKKSLYICLDRRIILLEYLVVAMRFLSKRDQLNVQQFHIHIVVHSTDL